MKKSITLRYFAQLAEKSGLDHEVLSGDQTTAQDWYQSQKQKYRFTLTVEEVRPAINGKYVSWNTELQDGDTLVFIPPVSGG